MRHWESGADGTFPNFFWGWPEHIRWSRPIAISSSTQSPFPNWNRISRPSAFILI
jgi:hypothetical protein